jgi:hypothetical protein
MLAKQSKSASRIEHVLITEENQQTIFGRSFHGPMFKTRNYVNITLSIFEHILVTVADGKLQEFLGIFVKVQRILTLDNIDEIIGNPKTCTMMHWELFGGSFTLKILALSFNRLAFS